MVQVNIWVVDAHRVSGSVGFGNKVRGELVHRRLVNSVVPGDLQEEHCRF